MFGLAGCNEVFASRIKVLLQKYIYVIDKACSVKMAGYWSSWPKNEVNIQPNLVNKGFIIWLKDYTKEFRFCGNKAGKFRAGKIGPSCPLG